VPDAPVSARLLGLDELAEGSRALAGKIGQGAGRDFQGAANDAAAVAAARIPRDSGRLAGSIESAYDSGRQAASVGMGQGVPYAGWIEFGGGRYVARPYMPRGRYLWPAIDAAARELQAAGERAADREIRRMQWPRPT
jgi:phage gpG-like protein